MKTEFGRATAGRCPKEGYACLIEKTFGRELVVKTRCKTWACLSCRQSLMAAVRLRIQYGCLILKHSSLITVTYVRHGPETLMSGPAVERHLRAWFSKLRFQYPNLSWFKVPELTKKKQIHLHLVLGGLGEAPFHACEREPNYGRTWRSRACVCLEHRLSKMWADVTGTSYVVDARPVVSPVVAASYLGKYLVKGMADRKELFHRGFIRRWSCSRNWPRGTLKMLGSEKERWWKTGFIGGYDVKMEKASEEDRQDPLLQRVGSAEAMEFSEGLVRRAKIAKLKERWVFD